MEPEELRRGEPVGEAWWPREERLGERPRPDPDLLLDPLDDWEALRLETREELAASGLPEPGAPSFLPGFLFTPRLAGSWL